jgi:hypothetical protein
LEEALPVEIFKGRDSFVLNLNKVRMSELAYYRIGRHFYLGVDDQMYLRSVFIEALTSENMNNIFGF